MFQVECINRFLANETGEKSSETCTFNTPFGRYQYLRLTFGISSAPEICHLVIHTLFAHLEGVETSMDDIIVWGSNKEEHDKRLEKVVETAQRVGLKVQKEKFEIAVPTLTFLGDKISASGLKPDPKNVEAILKLEIPRDKKELQRFLGMINYLSRFIPDLSVKTIL